MIEFHPKHAESLTLKTDELLKEARVAPATPQSPSGTPSNPPHPIAVFSEKDIIGEVSTFDSLINGEGEETGRFWVVDGKRIGWEGEGYAKIRDLARRLASQAPLKDYASENFIFSEIYAWLRESLEGKTNEQISERLRKRCEAETSEVEIWIPLERTYANAPITIGAVTFRAIQKSMLDGYYSKFPADVIEKLNRERSEIQALLAGCVTVKAEPQKAFDVALERVDEATALLRFLSHANWSCKIKCTAVAMGTDRRGVVTSINVVGGAVQTIQHTALAPWLQPWNVTENIKLLPMILPQLHSLALDHKSSDFRGILYDALLTYSRSCLTLDLSERLLFVLVALESIFLRDGNEGIQGNLAERLAFLIGTDKGQRIEIVALTRTIYALRSKFVHHGAAVDDVTSMEKFLYLAWQGLATLLTDMDKYPTRDGLITSLNDLKFT
jgi:hypothetical protein